jgi:hypothetical protein
MHSWLQRNRFTAVGETAHCEHEILVVAKGEDWNGTGWMLRHGERCS